MNRLVMAILFVLASTTATFTTNVPQGFVLDDNEFFSKLEEMFGSQKSAVSRKLSARTSEAKCARANGVQLG